MAYEIVLWYLFKRQSARDVVVEQVIKCWTRLDLSPTLHASNDVKTGGGSKI